MYRFLVKLLDRDVETMTLLAGDPWEDSLDAPKYIRVNSYLYRFHRPANDTSKGERLPYWDRQFLKRVYPTQGVATAESLRDGIPADRPV